MTDRDGGDMGAQPGSIARSLFESAKRQGAAHLVLVDPDRMTGRRATDFARECSEAFVDAIIHFPGAADQLFPGVDAVARATGTSPLPAARVVAHAQAAACLGMSMVYLEGGSGARCPVPTSLVRSVSRAVSLPVRPITDAVHGATVAV